MKLYIRNRIEELPQPWWDRFEASLISRSSGTERHIQDRHAKLDAHGALLQWDKDKGLPYLKFDNKKAVTLFLLKWS